MVQTPHKVGDILDCLDELSKGEDQVTVGAVMDAFGTRTYGPAIMAPALLELTPVGAIPGVPTFIALTIIIVAAQKMFGRTHLWLPGFISNRTVASKKLATGSEKLRPLARFLDRHFHRRLKFMTRLPFAQIAAGMIIVLCLTVPFLEVLPFASSVPMLAIAGFGLAVLVRDGVVMILALALSVAALGMGVDYWDGGLSDTEQADGAINQKTIDSAKRSSAAAENAVQEAADNAGRTARKAGDDIEKAAKGAGDRVKDAAGSD